MSQDHQGCRAHHEHPVLGTRRTARPSVTAGPGSSPPIRQERSRLEPKEGQVRKPRKGSNPKAGALLLREPAERLRPLPRSHSKMADRARLQRAPVESLSEVWLKDRLHLG